MVRLNMGRSVIYRSLWVVLLWLLPAAFVAAADYPLQRPAPQKPIYRTLPESARTDRIIFKFVENIERPDLAGGQFSLSGSQWDKINQLVAFPDKTATMRSHFSIDRARLDEMRAEGSARIGRQLPDLSRYYRINLNESTSSQERLDLVHSLNELDIVEIAYFAPRPEPAVIETKQVPTSKALLATPNWQAYQYYLEEAPFGLDAYYAWSAPGGKGEGVKVVDIEGNWIQTHEDLHGGVDDFHIGGSRINDPGWYNHGTAVLGEIAADSNSIGMTGIAFNVDLGTVSIGSQETSEAIIMATENTVPGDIILIELHAPGPHYFYEERPDQKGYVAMEFWIDEFDAISQASALGRIVVEAAGNGQENYDDTDIYGAMFNPAFRFSGAIMVGAANDEHIPEWFTNYGERVDVHGFGSDVFTLGYGDLYGSDPDDYYTAYFSGTSSASPIIVGACAVLQGVSKALYDALLDHNEMRTLLTDFSTPQAPDAKHIGPLPDLRGSVDAIYGLVLSADTTWGWVPLEVNFDAASSLAVDTWQWDFGDGYFAYEQTPTHTYTASGVFDVTAEIDAGGEIRSRTVPNMIIALADTIKTANIGAPAGATVEIVISANTSTPVNEIWIPLEFGGEISLTRDSVTTTGCRTEYFDHVAFLHIDGWYSRFTLKLENTSANGMPPLEPGDGPIAKIYMTISASATPGQTTQLYLDGYDARVPKLGGPLLTYEITSAPGSIEVLACDDPDDPDSDCILSGVDNCATTFNPMQTDQDSDGVGDLCDNCPTLANVEQQNSDTDSHGDLCDNCPTVDNEDQLDSDGDDVGDACTGCCDLRGDFDHSGQVDVSDVVAWVRWAFNGDPVAPGCEYPDGFYPECDLDDSGQVDVADIVYWINWSFEGGQAPVDCP